MTWSIHLPAGAAVRINEAVNTARGDFDASLARNDEELTPAAKAQSDVALSAVVALVSGGVFGDQAVEATLEGHDGSEGEAAYITVTVSVPFTPAPAEPVPVAPPATVTEVPASGAGAASSNDAPVAVAADAPAPAESAPQ